MGPNEQKLAAVRDATPESLDRKADEWRDARSALDDLQAEVQSLRSRARATWKGSDADSADAAFGAKLKTIERAQQRMQHTESGLRAGAEALTTAQARLDGLKPVPQAGSAPTEPGAGADKAAKEKYAADSKSHDQEVTASKAAAAERERVAGEAIKQLDRNLEAADDQLSKAAPRPDDVDSSYTPGSGPSSTAGGGTSAAPVVGGATGGAALGLATIGRPGRGKRPGESATQLPDVGSSSTSTDTAGDGSTPSSAPSQAGQAGGSGVGSAAGAAGALGAGKGILGKLTGAGKGAQAAASRTAGMQKGSTLGARTAGESAGSRTAGQSAGRGAGQSAGSRTAGQSAGSRTVGESAGSRTAGQSAGSRGAGSQSGGQSSPARGAGSRTAGQSSAARGGGSRTAGQAGGRGAPGSRTAGQQGGRGNGGPKDDRREKDQGADHLAFDDDQWLDDDETTPGVLR